MEAIPPPPIVANATAMHTLAAVDVDDGSPNARVTQAYKRREVAQGLLRGGFITQDEYTQHRVYLEQVDKAVAADGADPLVPPAWFGPAMAAAVAPLNAQQVNMNAQQVNMNAQLGQVAACLVDLNAQQVNMNARLDQVEANFAPIMARFAQVEARFTQVEARLTQIEAVVAPIPGQLAHLSASQGNIRAAITNIDARRHNSMAFEFTDTLVPPCNNAGAFPPNFPLTLGLLSNLMDPQLTALLQFYEIQIDGAVDDKRRRLKMFIGLFR